MANKQLVDYIAQQRTAGVEQKRITQALTEAGWAPQDILEAATVAFGSTTSRQSSLAQAPVPQGVSSETGSSRFADSSTGATIISGAIAAVCLVSAVSAVLWGFYVMFYIPMVQHAAQQDALKNGISGTAVVTAANFDGLMNYQGEFTITLQVTPKSGAPFSRKTIVFGDGSSQNSPYSPGMQVDVKYVPRNHDVVIVGPSL